VTWSQGSLLAKPRRAHASSRREPQELHMGYGYACGPGYGGRRYFSREERVAWLKDYAEELENELKGVQERLKELEAE
jgi:hypothetical protein